MREKRQQAFKRHSAAQQGNLVVPRRPLDVVYMPTYQMGRHPAEKLFMIQYKEIVLPLNMTEVMPVPDEGIFPKFLHQQAHFILAGNLFIMAAPFNAQLYAKFRSMGQKLPDGLTGTFQINGSKPVAAAHNDSVSTIP